MASSERGDSPKKLDEGALIMIQLIYPQERDFGMQGTESRDERAFLCRPSFEGPSKPADVGDSGSPSGARRNVKFKNHTNEPTKLLKIKESSFYTNQVPESAEVIPLTNQISENRRLTTIGHTEIRVESRGSEDLLPHPLKYTRGPTSHGWLDRETEKVRIQKPYERTRHLAENKQAALAEPVKLLKTAGLSDITRHVADGQWVS